MGDELRPRARTVGGSEVDEGVAGAMEYGLPFLGDSFLARGLPVIAQFTRNVSRTVANRFLMPHHKYFAKQSQVRACRVESGER